MTRASSITRRLTITVLLLEVLSAVGLIGAIAVHERHVQLRAFDATLQGTADTIMGGIQPTENESDNLMLDMRGIRLRKDAVFRAKDERGTLLGSAGDVPDVKATSPDVATIQNAEIKGRAYRLIALRRLKVVDPGESNDRVIHSVTIIYGLPVGHVWNEVAEAIRFFAIVTAILLGLTAAAMVWLLRRGLSPLHALAHEAERIAPETWQFQAPRSAKETKELRPLAEALEGAVTRLQRSFEQQRRFTNDAAHELKTDVAIVKSSLQLLLLRKRTSDEYAHGLALSLDDFTRLEVTVQKMLTLARLDQRAEQPGDTDPPVCSLREILEEVLRQTRPVAELRYVNIRMDITADVEVSIDSRDALLLFSNVLVNALQHSPLGSMVQIEMTFDHNTVLLAIRDQGDGIAKEDLPFLFEPFYRADPSRSRKSGGTGLGLSICKAICDHAGGSIEIVNWAPEGGAVVTIALPGKLAPRLVSASMSAR